MPVPPCRALNKAAAVVAATSSTTLLAQTTRVLGLQIYAPQTVQHLPKVSAEVQTVPVAESNLAQRASAEVCEHPPPGFSGIAHQEEQVPQGTVLRVRGGWFAKRKSCTGVEGLEVAKLPGHALRIIEAPDRQRVH